MGAGGQMSVSDESNRLFERVPVEQPPFTLSDLKKAIPPHCFKRSAIHSFYYVVHDLIIAYAFYFLADTYIPRLPPLLAYVAWPIYWCCQASILTGLWFIGHECGHHAFSEYQWLDDSVGFILHSALLTPYFAWKYSHRNHHANPAGGRSIVAITMVFRFPLYLLTNISGKKYDRFATHLDPSGPIFTDRERFQVILSDIGILVVAYALKLLVAAKGAAWVMCMYGVPLVGVNGFLIMISIMQHTHRSLLPHYDSSEWNWIRGALSTFDRDFGFLNKVLHDVTHTHVLHHMISYIPHYHAKEAMEAIRPLLGDYYKIDRTPFLKAMWREAKDCIYVEPDEDGERKGVYWYYNKM